MTLIDVNGFVVNNIYSADSHRAIATANSIAVRLNCTVKTYHQLKSTKAYSLSGISEEDAPSIEKLFMDQLKLYRAGLFNGYDFNLINNMHDKKNHERDLIKMLDEILIENGENIKIVIGHRSSITSILIYFARILFNYPQDFYGFIPLNLGHVSWLEYKSNWSIKGINLPFN